MSRIPVRRVLVSVSDKTGLVEFVKRLEAAGAELVSSGGTARVLGDAGIAVTEVSDVTGSPEMLGGRVKTLHPHIHGGILADLGQPAHVAELQAAGIEPFQLVVANLYPFEETVADPGVSAAAAIEQIDIGGPAMVRAAAKNHAWVGVVTSPEQYDVVASAIEAGGLDDELRRSLAAAAFYHTAAYDAAIVCWMGRAERVPPRLVLALERVSTLRYGENPHQEAAIYGRSGTYPWWRQAEQVQGKEMSFNNYADAEAAWRLACAFREPGAVVVKHTNPCGAAIDDSIGAAFERAWACDAQSAFGGVVALNRPLDVATAELIGANFVEVVIAPALEPEAHDILSRKSNLRILVAGPPSNLDHDVRGMEHGLLVQVRDAVAGLPDGWRVVAGEAPSERLCAELDFAWTVAAHTKSNAIVIGANRAAVGVGAGDQSRVGAAERAVARAGRRAQGGVAASDAFLPFRDGLDVLADAGVTALVEPGGSRRDDEVIAAAVERNVTLVFTGRRHFRH